MLNNDILKSNTLVSNAKVNIGLNIFDKADNGYHILESLIQEISLCDSIKITIFQSSGGVNIYSKGFSINVEDDKNTCYIIADSIKKTYNIQNRIDIQLDKKIPIGAGLGGGSSNAAAILNFCDEAFNLNIPIKEKKQICQTIGMDVPFFLNGGLQYAQGMGEVTTSLPSILKDCFFLIAKPQFSISTKWAYSKINKNLPSKKMQYNLLALEAPLKWSLFRNDFEDIVVPRYPEIRELKKAMLNSGAIYSSLSGSGSTVFGIYNNYNQAVSMSKKLDYKKYHITVTSPVYR